LTIILCLEARKRRPLHFRELTKRERTEDTKKLWVCSSLLTLKGGWGWNSSHPPLSHCGIAPLGYVVHYCELPI